MAFIDNDAFIAATAIVCNRRLVFFDKLDLLGLVLSVSAASKHFLRLSFSITVRLTLCNVEIVSKNSVKIFHQIVPHHHKGFGVGGQTSLLLKSKFVFENSSFPIEYLPTSSLIPTHLATETLTSRRLDGCPHAALHIIRQNLLNKRMFYFKL